MGRLRRVGADGGEDAEGAARGEDAATVIEAGRAELLAAAGAGAGSEEESREG